MAVYNIEEINIEDLLDYVYVKKNEGYRLIQISCTKLTDKYELNYSFGIGYDFNNVKISIDNSNLEIYSISHIFSPAFLYENEIQDLFGLKFKYLKNDYHGKLYILAKETPFRS